MALVNFVIVHDFVRTVAGVDSGIAVFVVQLVQAIGKGEEDEKPDHQKLGNVEQHPPEGDLNRTHVHVRVEKINLNFGQFSRKCELT